MSNIAMSKRWWVGFGNWRGGRQPIYLCLYGKHSSLVRDLSRTLNSINRSRSHPWTSKRGIYQCGEDSLSRCCSLSSTSPLGWCDLWLSWRSNACSWLFFGRRAKNELFRWILSICLLMRFKRSRKNKELKLQVWRCFAPAETPQ